jgi:hypothetical protein
MCDSDITSDEIIEALTAMSKNKSPGSDVLTTEFYCTFYDSLRNILPKASIISSDVISESHIFLSSSSIFLFTCSKNSSILSFSIWTLEL